jgi:hypothetical protein
MNASHRVAARTGTAVIATLAAGLILVTACRDLETSFEPGGQYGLAAADLPAAWVTGEVEFAWKGGKGEMGQQTDVVKHAMAEFNVFPPTAERPAKGEFYFRVYNEVYDDVEMTLEWKLHREVAVEVKGVYVDVAQMKGWFVGEVISDIKICTGGGGEGGECDCGGGGGGGHDGGCTHDDGGCTHDDGTTTVRAATVAVARTTTVRAAIAVAAPTTTAPAVIPAARVAAAARPAATAVRREAAAAVAVTPAEVADPPPVRTAQVSGSR